MLISESGTGDFPFPAANQAKCPERRRAALATDMSVGERTCVARFLRNEPLWPFLRAVVMVRWLGFVVEA